MVKKVLSLKKKHTVAVAWPHDTHTLGAVHKAGKEGFIEALLIGKSDEIIKLCKSIGADENRFMIIEADNDTSASDEAVRLTKSGEADIVMKGAVSTDKFLKAVLNKEKGIMLPNSVLSYVGALEIPAYHKLLFITDPAVIPYPDLEQKICYGRVRY